jgi:hypothetical protein
MRQWELFGITDSQPAWVPPKRVEPEIDTVVTVLDVPTDDDDLLPGPAAWTRPAPSQPSNDAAASSTARTSSGPCCVPRVHSS